MQIPVRPDVYLSEILAADKPAYLEHLADPAIYEGTLRIPYPYTAADADRWLHILAESKARNGRVLNFAIREPSGFLIGSCGFDDAVAAKSHRAEIGYWLARPYWGRGIATAVVGALVQFAATELALSKLTAHVFAHNRASARVLEKNGFVEEGYLRQHYLKAGRFVDARAYGLILEPANSAQEQA